MSYLFDGTHCREKNVHNMITTICSKESVTLESGCRTWNRLLLDCSLSFILCVTFRLHIATMWQPYSIAMFWVVALLHWKRLLTYQLKFWLLNFLFFSRHSFSLWYVVMVCMQVILIGNIPLTNSRSPDCLLSSRNCLYNGSSNLVALLQLTYPLDLIGLLKFIRVWKQKKKMYQELVCNWLELFTCGFILISFSEVC